jgi:serine/threonine protein kinase
MTGATMNINRIKNLAVLCSQRLIRSVRKELPIARQSARKPVLAGYFLLTAHRAQITLTLLLLFLFFLAPDIVDKITGVLFPPETSKKIFGLIKTQQAHPLKGVADVVIMTTLWIISIGSALLLFLHHIPEGSIKANSLAGKLISKADGSADQSHRSKLYRLALMLTTDTRLESQIASSLQDNAIFGSPLCARDMTSIDIPAESRQPLRGKSSPSPTIGPQGRYKLGIEVGKGAMGVVYQGWDNVLERKIAIKQLANVFSDDQTYAVRFRREATTLARLIHPNIVQVYDLIVDRGRLWMALEYVEGGNLLSYLESKGFLSVGEASIIVIPVAQGLAHAHDQGIVHRDLKPANILLTKDHIPKISDFGIAKISQSSELTQVGSVLGSPIYMSPEQCSGGSVDFRADIYSLGITLYKLLTGKVPFEGEASTVMARHIFEQPPSLPRIHDGIPSDMEKLILQMLAKSPDDRPSSMNDVVERLSSIIKITAISTPLHFPHTAV